MTSPVRVVAHDPGRPDRRRAFRELNPAWIERHFVVETRDRLELDGAFELVKMAVAESARGRGLGRRLGEAPIDAARAAGAPRVALLSNTVLGAAIGLHRALGFVEVPLTTTDYARANITLVLDLRTPAG